MVDVVGVREQVMYLNERLLRLENNTQDIKKLFTDLADRIEKVRVQRPYKDDAQFRNIEKIVHSTAQLAALNEKEMLVLERRINRIVDEKLDDVRVIRGTLNLKDKEENLDPEKVVLMLTSLEESLQEYIKEKFTEINSNINNKIENIAKRLVSNEDKIDILINEHND